MTTAKTKNGFSEIGKGTVDRITRQRTFEPHDRPQVGCRFIRFIRRGQEIQGVLGFPIENFQMGTSYPVQLDTGEIVEIIGNKLVHNLIRKGDLCGQYVKVVYQGRQFTGGGHHRKIYRIFKTDRPAVPKKIWDQIAADATAKKRS